MEGWLGVSVEEGVKEGKSSMFKQYRMIIKRLGVFEDAISIIEKHDKSLAEEMEKVLQEIEEFLDNLIEVATSKRYSNYYRNYRSYGNYRGGGVRTWKRRKMF